MQENNKLVKARSLSLDFLCMVAGSILYAVGVNVFNVPNNLAPGGVTGLSTMISYVLGTPVGIVVLLINIPIVVFAIIEIGYKFVAKTAVAILLNSVAIDVLGMFLPEYHGDMVIVALMSGACEGFGLGMVFMRGATTGGTDMIARLLNRRLSHLSMGKLMMVLDGAIIITSGFVFQSLESAVYACVVLFVSTTIIDFILYGVDIGTGKMFFIISEKSQEIADRILSEMDRGVTMIKSRGGYLKREGEMLFCAVRRFEVFRISEIIKSVDPSAFVIVGDAGEIRGEGFKSIKSDDKTLSELIEKVRGKKEDTK